MGALDGKVALVTGAASGIGRAVARTLAAEGAAVHAVDVQAGALAAVIGSLRAGGLTASPTVADVSVPEVVERWVAQVLDASGRIDRLANIAGLDGFLHEPVPHDHPLLRLDDVLLAPHLGGGSGGARAKHAEDLMANLICLREGRPVRHLLDRNWRVRGQSGFSATTSWFTDTDPFAVPGHFGGQPPRSQMVLRSSDEDPWNTRAGRARALDTRVPEHYLEYALHKVSHAESGIPHRRWHGTRPEGREGDGEGASAGRARMVGRREERLR